MLGSKFLGDADQCWEPVFLNLMVTDVLILWLEWLFLCVLKQQNQLANIDAHSMRVKFNMIILSTIFYMIALRYDFANTGMIIYVLCIKLKVIHDGIATTVTRDRPGAPRVAAFARDNLRKMLVALHGEFPHDEEEEEQDDEHEHEA